MFGPYFRRRDGRSIRSHTPAVAYSPLQVKAAYGIPAGLTGAGQTVGIIELGGAFSQADYNTFMAGLGLPTQTVAVVPVNGATITADPGGADVEVMLDVEIVGAFAPQAKIRVYFAANTSADFAEAVAQAATDGCDVISISWGGPEDSWSSSDRAAMDSAIQGAVNLGCNVYVAAGDNGSGDGESGSHVDYPASSPYATGCGGTRLTLNSNGTIASEVVWNDGSQGGATGGGFSSVYLKPSWQGSLVNGSMRGVPDVSGNGDPETGWNILANGSMGSVGGTSAVAPMWAGIQALLNQEEGKRFGGNALWYASPTAFYDTISGSNGAFNAGPGWDATTGMGSPKGSVLFVPTVPPTQPPTNPPTQPPTQPPTNPPVTPVPLFSITVGRAVRAGGIVAFRAPTAIPAGVYHWVPAKSPKYLWCDAVVE